jgi:hypothetical protein
MAWPALTTTIYNNSVYYLELVATKISPKK